jgi:hypothetical protein
MMLGDLGGQPPTHWPAARESRTRTRTRIKPPCPLPGPIQA